MSVQRRLNILSQQRLDSSDLKAFESAVSSDFDSLIQAMFTGTAKGYIIRGFTISMIGAIGGAASSLLLNTDPGAILHVNSSQSGTFYLVPTGMQPQPLNSLTNTIVDGAFTPNAINYVGVEYERFIDPTTSAQVYSWDPTQNDESTNNKPRAVVLRFRIKISTGAFASTTLPIATVITNSSNNVTEITNAKDNLYRLGTGGASPNPFNTFNWLQGRTENVLSSTDNAIDPFSGGDQSISSMKDWMDAIMSCIQEIKGTTYWYSLGKAGSIESLREDLGNTIVTGKGLINHNAATPGRVNWDENIYVKVIGSSITYTINANPSSTYITLSDDQAAYISLYRGVSVGPNLQFIFNSTTVTNASTAWTTGLQTGDWIKLGSEDDTKYYQISSVPDTKTVILYNAYQGASTGATGAKAKIAYGSYYASASPSGDPRAIQVANRNSVPSGQDIFWLLLRADNGGVLPRVYVRFIGVELGLGESNAISDGIPRQLLTYVGSKDILGLTETSTKPKFVESMKTTYSPASYSVGEYVPEITQITVGAASTITTSQYFFINSSADARKYYVWFKKDGSGTDPAPLANHIGIEVDISTGQTAIQVATAVVSALNLNYHPDFTAVQNSSPNDNSLVVTNNSAGATSDTVNFNVSAPFAVSTTQQGTGVGNWVVSDGDDLTKAVKKLDTSVGGIIASLDDPSYDEFYDVVSLISSGSVIVLPNNTRLGNIAQQYTVGKGLLEVALNGQDLRLGTDWSEIGNPGQASIQIHILQDLVIGDSLEFSLSGGGAGGTGGQVGPQGAPGVAGPTGADAIGSTVNVSTKNASYTVLSTDKLLLGDCSSNPIIFTLPAASSSSGRVFLFKKIDSTINLMTIQGNGADLIDGSNTFLITVQYASIMLISDGTQWYAN